MNVLVLNPASKVTKNVVRDVLYGCWCKGKRIGGASVPPFVLLMLATILKKAGHQVRFIDAQAEGIPLPQLQPVIKESELVIISTSTMSFNEDTDTLAEIKLINPHLKTVVYGSHPTYMPVHSLRKESVDIIIRTEPEFIVRDLVSRLSTGNHDWKTIAGIGYRENGQPVINPLAYFTENLDSLPFLDVTMLPKGIDYFNPVVRKMPYITTTTSRGCPGKCTFCTAPTFYGTKLRFQSPERVLAELEFYKLQGYREIYFRDETFTASYKRTQIICELMLNRNLNLSWIANARVGTVDKKLIQLMKRAGCHLLKMGVESGIQEILDRVNKEIKVTDTIQLFKWAREVRMDTHAHVMLGMPGETKSTLNQTIKFINYIKPTTATFGICTPYPGTPLFESVRNKFPEIDDGSQADFTRLHTEGFYNESYTELTATELHRAVQYAYRSFYLRLPYLINWIPRLFDPDDFKRIVIAGTNVLDFALRGE